MKFVSLLATAVFASLAASATNQADIPSDRLLSANSLRCQFGEGTQASWENGKLKLQRTSFGEGGTVTFDSIDHKTRRARIIGNVGSGDVMVIPTAGAITFAETALGGINVTTVFASYAGKSSLEFVAVTSRHIDVLDGPIPSQYHGTCRELQ